MPENEMKFINDVAATIVLPTRVDDQGNITVYKDNETNSFGIAAEAVLKYYDIYKNYKITRQEAVRRVGTMINKQAEANLK